MAASRASTEIFALQQTDTQPHLLLLLLLPFMLPLQSVLLLLLLTLAWIQF